MHFSRLLIMALLTMTTIHATVNEYILFTPFIKQDIHTTSQTQPGHSLEFSLSNHYIDEITQASQALLDYEKISLYWKYRTQFKHSIITLTLPFYHYSGGLLDSTINEWHQYFALPNAGRDKTQHNQQRLRLITPDKTLVDEDDLGAGIGDLRAQIAYPVSLKNQWVFTPVAQVSLPTGKEHVAYGSGKIGFSLGAGIEAPLGTTKKWAFAAQGFIHQNTRPKAYNGTPKRLSYQLDTALSHPLWSKTLRHTFSYYQSPIKQTGIREIDEPGVVYTIELEWNSIWTIYMAEDLTTYGAPDVVFGIRSQL